jgi:hypothetical protein
MDCPEEAAKQDSENLTGWIPSSDTWMDSSLRDTVKSPVNATLAQCALVLSVRLEPGPCALIAAIVA